MREKTYCFVDPEYGEMACGGEGWGRLARLDKIVAFLLLVAEELNGQVGKTAPRELNTVST